MALTYTGSGGIFTRLGQLFEAVRLSNVNAATTVPAAIKGFTDAFTTPSLALQDIIGNAQSANLLLRRADGSLGNNLAKIAGQMIQQMIDENVAQPTTSVSDALRVLIQNMIADAYYVSPNAPNNTLTAVTAIAGNIKFLYSDIRADGRVEENLLAERLSITATSVQDVNGKFSLLVQGQRPPLNGDMSGDWPAGSGCNLSISSPTLQSSLLGLDGGFDTPDDSNSAIPSGWIVTGGTPGTDCMLTTVEVQQIAITGTPTSGGYLINFLHPNLISYATDLLPYNATAAQIQTALRSLPGLAQVVVTTTSGTTPNLTHKITFTGLGGNIADLSIDDYTTGGTHTFTQSTLTSGDSQVRSGSRSLRIPNAGNGISIAHSVQLSPATVYVYCFLAIKTSTPTGNITISLGNGISDDLANDQGVSGATAFSVAGFTTSWAAYGGVFETPSKRIDDYNFLLTSDALGSAGDVWIDHLVLIPMPKLYAGGGNLACFSTDPQNRAALSTQVAIGNNGQYTVANTLSNSGAAGFQSWFDRAFGMRSLGLLLPSSGSTLINDNLIA